MYLILVSPITLSNRKCYRITGFDHIRSIHVPHPAVAHQKEMDAHNAVCPVGSREASFKCTSDFLFYGITNLFRASVQIPVEVNSDSSFKDVRAVLGRWMDVDPNNVRPHLFIVLCCLHILRSSSHWKCSMVAFTKT